MLTLTSARKLVRDCLREQLGPSVQVVGSAGLRHLGISGKALQQFKKTLAARLTEQGYKTLLSELMFNDDTTLASVVRSIWGYANEAYLRAEPVSRRGEVPTKGWVERPVSRPGEKGTSKNAAARKVGAKKISTKKIPVERGATGSARPRTRPTPLELIVRSDSGEWAGTISDREGSQPPIYVAPAPTESGVDAAGKTQTVTDIPQFASHESGECPAQGSPTREVVCTPQLALTAEIEKGTLYGLEVYLDQGPAAPGADVRNAVFDVPADVKQFTVNVWFDCSTGLELENMPEMPQLFVQTDSGTSDHLSVRLRLAPSLQDATQPLFITAFFRFNDRPSGKITRFLEYQGGKWAFKGARVAPRSAPPGEVLLPGAFSAAAAIIDTAAEPADIRVEVLGAAENDGRHFTLRCVYRDAKWEGAWNTPQVTKLLVDAYMKQVIQAPPVARVNRLRGAGREFWRVLPEPVRDIIANALAAGAASLSIVSEEPYIPWELMVPDRLGGEKPPPLGVQLRMGRWVTGNYISARQTVAMRSMHIICPTTSGLASSSAEASMLEKLGLTPSSLIRPASYAEIDRALERERRDIIHFICHGRSADLQTLQLETPDTLDCSEVRELDGFRTAFKGGAFAFLNACEVGREVLTLSGVGGFANSFIELGASAVVAPLWSVQDSIALDVATRFYEQALQGKPFADILKCVRADAYTQGIDSYAAYCFYGDPNAKAA